MKKIYNYLSVVALHLLAFVTFTSQVSAQQTIQNTGLSTKLTTSKGIAQPINKVRSFPHSNSSTATTESYWENDALANDFYLGGTPTAPVYVESAYPVFADSTVLFTFSNGNFNTFVDLCGNVLDPYAPIMQSYVGSSWNKFNDYTVDSMAVGIAYARTTSSSIVDTMVVYLYSDVDTANVKEFYFPNSGMLEFNLGIDTTQDTLIFKGMAYDYLTNRPKVTPSLNLLQTFKIPLTEADSGVQEKVFGTNSFHVPGGMHAISAVGFIPGYSYSPGDVITNTANTFRIIAFEENGTGTYPTYFGKGGFSSGQKDWNVSEIVTKDERYNVAGNSWNGNFIPEWAFLLDYNLEEWDINYKVTSTFNVGMKESISEAGTKLYQNQPNPTNHTTLIKYETQSAGSVVIEVRDLTGRLVMELNQGTQSVGTHGATINVSGLSNGMYTYTLKTNSESLTRRMIISE